MNDMEIDSLPALLTVMEMSKVLIIGRVVAYELIHQDNFPVLRVGPGIRTPKHEVLQ